MLDDLYQTYTSCREERLGARVRANQAPPADNDQRRWEKTIEALYASAARVN
ncbi:hypothetical protein [Pseudoduganella armeniaca]|uniref:hypothetical protein n=1 Tax=Pseudoduganella armeniaca TaxID=2072590 RepID=UPI0015E703BB|nr:hypothetical protein [Pseudoduganella armeniaca]